MAIDINRIMKESQRAVCGVFEREAIVDPKVLEEVKTALRKKGQIIIGTGGAPFGKKKVWFNPAGANL